MSKRGFITWVALLFLVVRAVTGCTGEGITVDYRGPHGDVVGACVNLVTSSTVRDDDQIPNRVAVEDVSAEQVDGGQAVDPFTYEVSGITVVEGSSRRAYLWECHVDIFYEEGQLVAKVTKFEPADGG